MDEQTPNPTPAPESVTAPPPLPADRTSPDKDARTMGMLCHLLGLAGFVGIPLGNIIGPLVIWLIKKDQHPFIDDQGKEAVNFQITMTIAAIVAFVLIFVFIGFLLLPALLVLDIVFIIIATIKANSGEWYRYPFALRLIK